MPVTLAKRRKVRPGASKPFRPGTTGWSIADLDDPAIERQFAQGRFEIVDGVLTEMPPAYFDGGYALSRLCRIVEAHLARTDAAAALVSEVDLILGPRRAVVADAIYLNPSQMRQQAAAYRRTAHRRNKPFGRIVVAPELLIESISSGHEAHDRETKRRWYAEFGIANFWLLDAMDRTLQCLILSGGEYQLDCRGGRSGVLRPSSYPGLAVQMRRIWL